MSDWRRSLKLVAGTAVVTSAIWLAIGAVVLGRYQGPRDAPAASPAAVPTASPSPRVVAPAPPLPEPVGRLRIPVAGFKPSQLVDTFTQARGGGRPHDAIDILAPRGTPVVAAAPGRVEKLFLSKPGGLTVYQRSPDGTLIFYYAHLDAYAPGLAEGRQLRAGDPVGTVGSTGNANPAAPHLHFAVMRTTPEAKWWHDAVALNPYPLLVGR